MAIAPEVGAKMQMHGREYGETLNNTFNVCSYGSKYYYCHIDETHMPKDSEELESYKRIQ